MDHRSRGVRATLVWLLVIVSTSAIQVPLFAATPSEAVAVGASTNWPMWRGPHGDGRSDESKIPTRWSTTENVAWRVDVPGWGHSSPVVWGDRVFVTSYVPDGSRRVLLCINTVST
jgi:putative pyrroloquinoline-quinone-binding quinoprotein